MTKLTKRALLIAVLLGVSGCYLDFKRDGRPALVRGQFDGRGTASASDRGVRPGFGSKPVVGKQPPTRLMARDGTSCVASKEKYDSTNLGTSVWCTWIDTSR